MERSLHNACVTAIRHGNALSDIRVPCWAATYRVSEATVMDAWEQAQSELSRQPCNQYEEGYGK